MLCGKVVMCTENWKKPAHREKQTRSTERGRDESPCVSRETEGSSFEEEAVNVLMVFQHLVQDLNVPCTATCHDFSEITYVNKFVLLATYYLKEFVIFH